MAYALEVVDLEKRYPAVIAVDNLSLAIDAGEVFGFLGRNGAGKTTTLKVVLDLVKPTGGEARLFGEDWRKPALRRRVGYLPELPVRYPYLSPRQYLDFSARLFGLDGGAARKRADDLLERVGMADAAGRKMGGFSKGMQQRVGLAQALINDPELLILDEPTAGLDPLGHRLVKELVAEYASRGRTIVISSHILAEIEQQCTRVAIVEKGRLLAAGKLDELLKPTNVVAIEVDAATPSLRAAFDKLATKIDAEGTRFTLTLIAGKEAADVSRAAAAAGAVVTSLVTRRLSLEDVFVTLVNDDNGGEVAA